jgi:hypothetical protein
VIDFAPPSIPRVCDVVHLRGAKAPPRSPPDVLLEIPHGATLAADFDELRAEFKGSYPDRLEEFFFVNTDVGAPEVAARAAALLLPLDPRRAVVVITSRIPRTFVDCNRIIDPHAAARPSGTGDVTPGLMPWMTHDQDRALALDRYTRYRGVVAAWSELVLDRGGVAIQVHTYAPRNIDVPVDGNIVATLRNAYAPDALARWPLRPEIDLIVVDPTHRRLAAPRLAQELRAGYEAAKFGVAEAEAYTLHPATVAGHVAARYPGRTLCYEIRRDLLVDEFIPFRPMRVSPEKVERHAAILAGALDRNGLRA